MKPSAAFLICLLSSCGGAQQAEPAAASQAAAGDSDKEARNLFDEGKQAFARGDYEAAIAAWEAGYAKKPAAEFQFNLGEAEIKANRPGKAAEHLRRYLAEAPEASNRAQVEATLAQLDAAAASDEATRLFDEGRTKFAAKKYDEAIADWEAGHAKSPSPVFTYNIAQAHEAAGRKDEALKYLKRYLDEAPTGAMRSAVEAQIKKLERRSK